jgi:hypothetical protein
MSIIRLRVPIRVILCAGAVLAVATLTGARVLTAQSASSGDPAERSRALAIADSALAAITRGDAAALDALMYDGAISASVRHVNGQSVMRMRTRSATVPSPPISGIIERGFDPVVQVSGGVALVWYPYDLYQAGNWSHCGVDTFSMLRHEGRWRIVTMTWSVEQPPACRTHPSGPPPGLKGPPGTPR